MSPKSNYKIYRTTLMKALSKKRDENNIKNNLHSLPILPYIGIYLRDLTFMMDGNPTKMENDFYNFIKIIMIGSLLSEIENFQQQNFSGKN